MQQVADGVGGATRTGAVCCIEYSLSKIVALAGASFYFRDDCIAPIAAAVTSLRSRRRHMAGVLGALEQRADATRPIFGRQSVTDTVGCTIRYDTVD